MRARWIHIVTAATLLAGGACTSETSSPRVEPENAPVFPNTQWYTQTTATTTGYALSFDAARSPKGFLGDVTDWDALLTRKDGFSPLQSILIETESGCPALPQPGQELDSISEASPIHIESNGQRVPWLGEPGEDPDICEIYPLQPYAAGSSVEVTITAAFDAALTGGLVPPYRWSFPVGTMENRVAPMYRLRDDALAWASGRTDLMVHIERNPADGPTGTDVLASWKGTYRIPDYTGPDGEIVFGEDGRPVRFGEATEQFFLVASTDVTQATAPLPLVQYGHGLFGDPREVWGSGTRELRRQTQGIFGAVAWGMAVRYFHRAVAALANPSDLQLLQDQVLQSQINQIIFTRVFRDEIGPLLADELAWPVSDVADYIGISQGGILGSPLMAISPDIRRAVLHVGGGSWTPMMTHSSNWADDSGSAYGDVVAATVPDDAERTLMYALWQSIWDVWDPAVFAPYWHIPPAQFNTITPPSNRAVYYPYSIDDPQVPNFSSHIVMRAADMPLLTPSVVDPDLVKTVDYPAGLPNVAAEWDVGSVDAAHGEVRKLPAFAAQVNMFLRTGIVDDFCGGDPCRFDP